MKQWSLINQRPSGFTLIEVMVAVVIMAVAFSGIMTVIILSRESEMVAKNNLIAASLSKEAFDMVRYMRDYNYSLGTPAFTGLADTSEDEAVYRFLIGLNLSESEIEVSPYYVAEAADEVTEAEAILSDAERYGYNNETAEPRRFRRLVTTTYHAATADHAPYLRVRVETHWRQDIKQNTYELTGELSDWR